eukprot:9482992-Alexandrium_andersonii.AAC.1
MAAAPADATGHHVRPKRRTRVSAHSHIADVPADSSEQAEGCVLHARPHPSLCVCVCVLVLAHGHLHELMGS